MERLPKYLVRICLTPAKGASPLVYRAFSQNGNSFRRPFLPFFLLLESPLPSVELAAADCALSGASEAGFCTSFTWGGAGVGGAPSLDDDRLSPDPAAGVFALPGAGAFGPGAGPDPPPTASMPNFCVACAAGCGAICAVNSFSIAAALATSSGFMFGSPTLADRTSLGCFWKSPITFCVIVRVPRLCSSALL